MQKILINLLTALMPLIVALVEKLGEHFIKRMSDSKKEDKAEAAIQMAGKRVAEVNRKIEEIKAKKEIEAYADPLVKVAGGKHNGWSQPK